MDGDEDGDLREVGSLFGDQPILGSFETL